MIYSATRINAMIPAFTIALRDDAPSVGLIVEKLSAKRLNGREPALILSARAFALSASIHMMPVHFLHGGLVPSFCFLSFSKYLISCGF
mgnify:CR=1 FL=1